MTSCDAMILKSKVCLASPEDAASTQAFEKAIVGGYSATPLRIAFSTACYDEPMYVRSDEDRQTYELLSEIIKSDENNQYGKCMTYTLPHGGYMRIELTVEKAMQLCKDFSKNAFRGYIIACDIELDSEHTFKNDIFTPIFNKSAISIKKLGLIQTYERCNFKKNGSVSFKKQTEKNHCYIDKQVKVYLFLFNIKEFG